jgi:hypothetical protein
MADIFDLADTWNDGATTFTAIKMNVTDTASDAESLLINMQVGGADRFKVRKDGKITFGVGDEAVELFTRADETPGFGVPVFRAKGTNYPTALDLYPNGTGGSDPTGKAWIHVLAQDLSQFSEATQSAWQAIVTACRLDGTSIGAMRGGYNTAVTGVSANGTTVVLSFAAEANAPFLVGSIITVSGVTPSGFNGDWTVTACTTTSVTFASTATSYVSGGTISMAILPLSVSGSRITLRSTPTGAAGTDYLMLNSAGAYFGGATDANLWVTNTDLRFKSGMELRWYDSASNPYGNNDLTLERAAAGIMALSNTSGTTGAAIELTEMTAPSAPATNKGRLYLEDNGSGKTRLVVRFPTGAAQVLATEP